MDLEKEIKNIMKPLKRYKLYCPEATDISGKGYNTFKDTYYKSKGNVIEQLSKYGAMMNWYQIVDRRNQMKVIKEKLPENEAEY